MHEYEDDYKRALKAAGAQVLAFERFGSYQGDWAAIVKVNGKTGFIVADYGSCSGCDNFEAAFSYRKETPETLADFGREYLKDIKYDLEEAAAHATWSMNSDEVNDWLRGEWGRLNANSN